MRGGFGAFGKIPALGDFLRAAPPDGFVEAWDPWLQRALLSARGALGGRWQECYFSAPIWRFTLAQGLAGRLPGIGILMPSVDRVGRQFPLTLMAALPQGAPVVLTHLAADAVFGRLEEIALETLERDLGRDQLLQRLALLPGIGTIRPAVLNDRGGALSIHGARDRPVATDMAAALVEARMRQPSVWSTLLTEGTRVMVTEGLPREAQAVGLMDLGAPFWAAEGTT